MCRRRKFIRLTLVLLALGMSGCCGLLGPCPTGGYGYYDPGYNTSRLFYGPASFSQQMWCYPTLNGSMWCQ